MSRADEVGIFWDDTPVPVASKEKIKREPPPHLWDRPDYLPYLAEARAFDIPYLTAADLIEAQRAGDVLMLDTEVARNYFLIGFRSYLTGKVTHFELCPGGEADWSHALPVINWIMRAFPTVGFNSRDFDLTLIAMALDGCELADLKAATDFIIKGAFEPGIDDFVNKYRYKLVNEVNHIDLIKVCPLEGSLKAYGGRLHAPRIQDLPFDPDRELTPEQIACTRWYCLNGDLTLTAIVYDALREQLQLRERLSAQYGIDMRSKSDPQVAEAVLRAQITGMSRRKIQQPEIEPGRVYKYLPPFFLRYRTPLLNDMLRQVREADFIVAPNGTIPIPDALEKLQLRIGNSVYQMGVGGLHSNEKSAVHIADAEHIIVDIDVSSYYPKIMLNTNLAPEHLGFYFTDVYGGLVKQRLDVKARGDKAQAESLKIAINGTFGKLSSPYSFLYAPNMGMQVTVTGQLSLLMLIESIELCGIPVVSGNTDGIVVVCPKNRQAELMSLIHGWESVTGFETEQTFYRALYSRDVNNYIAVKMDGKTKNKGAYNNPWAHLDDAREAVMRFHKNPTNTVCIEAVENFLIRGTPISETIRNERDVRKFVTVRSVRGGATKDGEYLGKTVRWYYALETEGEIVYILSGNKVPRSDGAKPLPDLPAALPADIDFAWYEREAHDMLVDLGAIPPDPPEAKS